MPDSNNCFWHLSAVANFLTRVWFLPNFGEKYCILCLFSSCEMLACCEFEFVVFYWIDDLTLMSKTIIDVKHFEFRWSRITGNCCNENVELWFALYQLMNIFRKFEKITMRRIALSKSGYYKERQVDRKKRQAIRRWFVSIRHGRHVLSQCPKQRQSPPGNIKKCLLIPGENTSVLGTG